jgi:hypothetical protein
VTGMTWFSGSCRRLFLVEEKGAVTEELSVYVFRAEDEKRAFRRLLELARAEDRQYENAEGEQVRWALVSLDSLDELTEGRLQDLEVFSQWRDIDPPDRSILFSASFQPEKSKPRSSGVGAVADIRARSRPPTHARAETRSRSERAR